VERLAIKVPKDKAEKLRGRLKRLGLLNPDYKPFEKNGMIYFPLKADAPAEILMEFEAAQTTAAFEARKPKPRSLKDSLKDKLPKDLIDHIPSSYDIVGSVILIEIPDKLRAYSKLIGEELMKIHPRIETVLAKIGGTRGIYRIRELEVIAGTGQTETIHKEHGCIYKLDLRKAFFNPRFSGERLRVARKTRAGEKVLDMFSGIGPFSILIAKTNPRTEVVAIEINPDAYRFLLENIKLNKVGGRIKPILGDSRKILEKLDKQFDRVIVDLPHSSLDYLDIALRRCKPGGMIHLYMIGEGDEAIEESAKEVLEKAKRLGYKVEVEHSRRVLEIAPKRFILALDLKLPQTA